MDVMALEPGAATTLHLVADLTYRTGKQRFVSYLKEKGRGEWTCELETIVFPRAEFKPATFLAFGAVKPGQVAEKLATFCVYGRTKSDLPESVTFRMHGTQATIAEKLPSVTEVDQGGVLVRKFPVRVRLKVTEEGAAGSTSLTATFGQGVGEVESKLSIDWQLAREFLVSPSFVFFGGLSPGESDMRSVVIRRLDGSPFRIIEITGGSEGLACTAINGDKPLVQHIVTVVVDRSKPLTALVHKILLKTDSDSQQRATITVGVAARE